MFKVSYLMHKSSVSMYPCPKSQLLRHIKTRPSSVISIRMSQSLIWYVTHTIILLLLSASVMHDHIVYLCNSLTGEKQKEHR